MLGILASRLLGLVRERAVADIFGRSPATDAYYAAFSIPDLMYYLLIGGALSSAFIPVFTEYLAKGEEKEAWYVASSFINVAVLVLLGMTVTGILFAPVLAPVVAYGFRGEQLDLLVRLMRIMFPAVFFTALAGMQGGILNSYRHFGAPAAGPLAYNMAIIAGAYLLGPRFGVVGMASGVVLGAIASFLVQFLFVLPRNAGYRLTIDVHHPGPRKMLRLFLPALLGLSITQVNLLVNQNLASGLPGGITALRLANRLMQLPLGLFATAISTVMFPSLTRLAALGKTEDFRASLSKGLRAILFITVPASVGLGVLAVPIVRLLYQTGEFTSADTRATALALVFYSAGLFSQSGVQFLTRAYYSLQDTATPVKVGLFTVAANIALSAYFVSQTNLGHAGVALAFSITSLLDMALLLGLLKRKSTEVDGATIVVSLGKSLAGSAVMAVLALSVTAFLGQRLDLTSTTGRLIEVGAGVTVGGLGYVATTAALRTQELTMMWRLLVGRAARRSGAA